jgi:integration host factor subunit alpha
MSTSISHPELSYLPEEGTNSTDVDTLTKAHLVALLVDRLNIGRRESKEMVDTFFEIMSDTLIQGENLKLSGFGNFHVRSKGQRPGRNPRTGQAVAITPRHVVTFHASAKLKEEAQDCVDLCPRLPPQ